MAFDASIRALDLEARSLQGAQARTQIVPTFRPGERVALMLGAVAAGGAVGFIATMSLGSLPPWAGAVAAAPIYIGALHLVGQSCRETWANRDWPVMALFALLLAAMVSWPLTMLLNAPATLAYWAGPLTAVAALTAFALFASVAPRAVYRITAVGLLVAVLCANQGTLAFMGN